MAIDITVNLNDERESELNKLTTEANRMLPLEQQLTPSQFCRRHTREWLDFSAAQRADRDRLTLREAYKLATPEEQAQIDALLAPYR